MIQLSIKDEHFSGRVLRELNVDFQSENVTIRDIIEARVRHEVEQYNNKKPDYYQGLVEPTDAEKTLNGYKLHSRKVIDAEQQVYTALAAFQKNGFFVLVDNEQHTNLEQQIRLNNNTHIAFIKLTPLVGG